MLTDYIKAAMRRAKYEIIEDDGTFFGHIPEIQGAWGNAATLEECRDELESAVEDWILISFQHRLPIPIIDGIDLNAKVELVEDEAYQPA
ncbi:MAG: type II toxin-antitoxin system HicB family antitoxin [Calditrichaeota bacterium]|nr:type II toxin-antitoxin system HicB family antitoxin [Calditrichota bacterium]